ncbi:MAG: metallophosphoesterase [Candidatus Dormibacteraeota bacterium]|nr:metallophosphoesterase [Candidatus Dormibacteraeota bacterium]
MSAHPPSPVRPRRFGQLAPEGALLAQRQHGQRSNQAFEPLPRPTGVYPYHLELDQVLPLPRGTAPLVFHCVGDTGGVKNPTPQQHVAAAMAAELGAKDGGAPLFLYHLGDVVYFYGAAAEYYPQFYEPYQDYPIPIFAIPGNHDGAVDPTSPAPTLEAFVQNFCATDPHLTPEAEEVDRHAMTQPNVYWTLETPRVTMVGLYSNVPEGGRIQTDQAAWLEHELAAADPNLPVIVALHHPVYSLDSTHGGDPGMQHVLDTAFEGANRVADAVFTGHVHNYQRFIRKHGDRQVPYIVAGGGGYHNLHRIRGSTGPVNTIDGDQVELASYCDDQYGFMRITVSRTELAGEYVAVSRTGQVTEKFDSWSLDLKAHTIS